MCVSYANPSTLSRSFFSPCTNWLYTIFFLFFLRWIVSKNSLEIFSVSSQKDPSMFAYCNVKLAAAAVAPIPQIIKSIETFGSRAVTTTSDIHLPLTRCQREKKKPRLLELSRSHVFSNFYFFIFFHFPLWNLSIFVESIAECSKLHTGRMKSFTVVYFVLYKYRELKKKKDRERERERERERSVRLAIKLGLATFLTPFTSLVWFPANF